MAHGYDDPQNTNAAIMARLKQLEVEPIDITRLPIRQLRARLGIDGVAPTSDIVGKGAIGIDLLNESALYGTPTTPTALLPDDAASEGDNKTSARSDHKHAIATDPAGTIEPDDAAAEGVASSFARSDHKHAIVAAAPGAIAAGDAAAEGAATSFARSDHKHTAPATWPPSAHTHPESEVTSLVADLAAKAPLASPVFTGNPQAPTPAGSDDDTSIATTEWVNDAVAGGGVTFGTPGSIEPDDAAAAGAASTAARSDHKHSIVAAAPGAVTAGDSAAEGTATSFARSDHKHSNALAPLASPVFTGDPQAPTPAAGDNDVSIATTAYVVASRPLPANIPVFDNAAGTTVTTGATGRFYAGYAIMTVEKGSVITGVFYFVAGTANGNCRCAIYSSAGTKLADRTSASNQPGTLQIHKVPLDGAYTVLAADQLIVVLWFSSATATAFGSTQLVPHQVNTNATVTPTSITPSNLTHQALTTRPAFSLY